MIDLTEATMAAARAIYEEQHPGESWDAAPPAIRFRVMEAVLPAVTAAAPLLYAQGFEEGKADGYEDGLHDSEEYRE